MAKKKQSKEPLQLSPENYIRQKARTLPLFECMINTDWEICRMASVSVARKHSNGNITAGMFLVDLYCLGVIDAHCLFSVSESEYRTTITKNNHLKLIEISYELAHNIIYAGLDYAKELGFNPHKAFSVAQYVLEEDTDEIEFIKIECGKNGKPFYVKTEWQSEQESNRIIAQLDRSVGNENYDVLLPSKNKKAQIKDVNHHEDKHHEDKQDEFSELTFEEKQELFHQLLKSLEKQNNIDHEKLGDLVTSVFNDLIDKDLIDDLKHSFVDDLQVDILPFEEIPYELWGIEPGKQIITDQITDLFIESYTLVKEKSIKGIKKIKELKKIVGNIPAVRLLELMVLELNQKEDKSFEMIIGNYEKFPDYPIFRLQLLLPDMNYLPIVQLNLMPDLHRLFYNRSTLHEIEFMTYIFTLLKVIHNEANATKLEALLWAIQTIEIPEKIKKEVLIQIMELKFMFVISHFTPKEEDEE